MRRTSRHDAVEIWQRVREFVVSRVSRSEGSKLLSKLLLLFGVNRKFDQCPLRYRTKVNIILITIW